MVKSVLKRELKPFLKKKLVLSTWKLYARIVYRVFCNFFFTYRLFQDCEVCYHDIGPEFDDRFYLESGRQNKGKVPSAVAKLLVC